MDLSSPYFVVPVFVIVFFVGILFATSTKEDGRSTR
jgi:hypothetical protein